ncbi:MAG: DUF5615 family PIN-like protein [Planctomycetes bacterium]|nr:DUF5615 family PIN-like protein [Planctomycetota bacterium]
MRFKLDENFDLRLIPLVAEGGHDVDTVLHERMLGRPDETIYEACLRTRRTLVTLDLDCWNAFLFPPDPTAGIVVVRPPRAIPPLIRTTLASALPALKARDLTGRLWIVEPARIRVYDPREERGG